MNENKEKGIGDFLGNLAGATAPIFTGLIKPILSPAFMGSVVKMGLNILNTIVNAISSLGVGKILSSIDLSSIVEPVLQAVSRFLDSLLRLFGPLLEALFDMMIPLAKIIGPLLESLGRIFKPLGAIFEYFNLYSSY